MLHQTRRIHWALAAAVLAVPSVAGAATTLALWDFSNTNNAPSVDPTGSAQLLPPNNFSFNVNPNTGPALAIPVQTPTPSVTLALNTTGWQNLSLSFLGWRSSTAYNSNSIQWSLDNFNFTPLAASPNPVTFPVGSTSAQTFSYDFSGTPLSNAATAYFRVAFGGTGTAGGGSNSFLDNITISGDAISGGGNNDSQIYVGTAVNPNGSSSTIAHLGQSLVGHAPPPLMVGLVKTGTSATTFSLNPSAGLVAVPSPGTSFAAGNQGATISLSLAAGQTATAGVKSYTLAVDNTAATSAGPGLGSNDADDLITVSAQVFNPAQVSVVANATTYDSGHPFTISSAPGANFAAAEIKRTISGPTAADWEIGGLLNAVTALSPGGSITAVPNWIGGARPNGTYSAVLTLAGQNHSSIAGASSNDLFSNRIINLAHIVTDSMGGTVPLNAGSPYAGLGVNTGNTNVSIRYGTASAPTSLEMHMIDAASLADPGYEILGDAVEINNIVAGDVYVLELSFPPTPIDLFSLAIVSRPGTTGAMQLAVAANTSGNYPPSPIVSSFDQYLASQNGVPTLGDYGIDPSNQTIWAVLNHNSQFAVAAIPEPASLALLLSAATIARRRRHRI